jgi:RND family efflux transporter MFP subunit
MTPESSAGDLSSLRISRDKKKAPEGMSPRSRIILAVVICAVLGVAGFLFFRGGVSPTAEVEMTSAVMTSPSQASAVLTASGYVVAQQRAAVASKGTGRLVYLGVEEGDRVKKGQILARIEDADMVAGLDRARANLEVAQAEYGDAERTFSRTQSLFNQGLASQAEIDAANSRFARIRAAIAAARATVAEADVAFENTRIRAPFDGTVLTKDADIGEVVAPFAASAVSRGAVVTMADMKSLQVEADVSESNIMRVSGGQPCEIVLDSYPEKRYRGTVYKIVPTADRAKATVLTKVAFLDLDERVLPEMSAKVTFLAKGSDTANVGVPPRLTVAASAVASRNGRSVVFVIRDGQVTETPVTTGATTGNRVEITGGLTQGDRLVDRPDASLATGHKVRVKE